MASKDPGHRPDVLREHAERAKGLIDKLTDAHAQDVKTDVGRHLKELEAFLKFIKQGMREGVPEGDE